jgi:osmoprotectant transport system permease protein
LSYIFYIKLLGIVSVRKMLSLIFGYFSKNGAKYLGLVARHLEVSLLSLLIACLIGIPLGILCSQRKNIRAISTGVFAMFRVIPSLAILLLCLPLMGTGVRPAVAALAFLAIPPILINTTLAFSSTPAFVLETAAAMGMSKRRVFFLIKVPLSLPLTLTGFRTAALEVIASATLAAYIGGGGLGDIIFTGLGLMRTDLLLIGGVSVALLSILADYALNHMENSVHKSLFGEVR